MKPYPDHIQNIANKFAGRRPNQDEINELAAHGWRVASTGVSNILTPGGRTTITELRDNRLNITNQQSTTPISTVAGTSPAAEQLFSPGVPEEIAQVYVRDMTHWDDDPEEIPDGLGFGVEDYNPKIQPEAVHTGSEEQLSLLAPPSEVPITSTRKAFDPANEQRNIPQPVPEMNWPTTSKREYLTWAEKMLEGWYRGLERGIAPDPNKTFTEMNIEEKSYRPEEKSKVESSRGTTVFYDPGAYVQQTKELGLPGGIGYLGGRVAGDIAFNGTPQYLWDIHPAEKAGHLAMDAAKAAGLKRMGRGWTQYAAGAAMGTAAGVMNPFNPGEAFRPMGFSAITPSDEDPRKPENWSQDMIARWPLMRSSKILPWEQFNEEKPDVTEDQYNRYRAFLKSPGVGGFGLLKFTTDSVRDPTGLEAQLMGFPITPSSVLAGTLGALGAMSLARGEFPNRIGLSRHFAPKFGFDSDEKQIELDLDGVPSKPEFRASFRVPDAISVPATNFIAGTRDTASRLFARP